MVLLRSYLVVVVMILIVNISTFECKLKKIEKNIFDTILSSFSFNLAKALKTKGKNSIVDYNEKKDDVNYVNPTFEDEEVETESNIDEDNDDADEDVEQEKKDDDNSNEDQKEDDDDQNTKNYKYLNQYLNI